ncbi:hypothetical protein ACWDZZ_19440 [Streptomyces sp. NPDC002990]
MTTAGARRAAVWWRLGRENWQTLAAALDNPDGGQLYHKELAQARAETAGPAAAERQKRRPVCGDCAKFTDERWGHLRRRALRSPPVTPTTLATPFD